MKIFQLPAILRGIAERLTNVADNMDLERLTSGEPVRVEVAKLDETIADLQLLERINGGKSDFGGPEHIEAVMKFCVPDADQETAQRLRTQIKNYGDIIAQKAYVDAWEAIKDAEMERANRALELQLDQDRASFVEEMEHGGH